MQKFKSYCFYVVFVIFIICLFASFETGGSHTYADKVNLTPDRMYLVYADKADELSSFAPVNPGNDEDETPVKAESYKLGDISPYIREYKLKLAYLGLMKYPDSTIFDTPTEQAVKDYQENNNLEVTGILDSLTMNLLDGVEIAFRLGDTDEEIGDYQAMLSRLGYLEEGYTINTFDAVTEEGLKKYQEEKKLGVTATFSSDTIKSLQNDILALDGTDSQGNEDQAQ